LQPYVLFTGTMDYLPNIDAVQFFCREVFPLVRSRVPAARFVIAGRNPSADVKRLAMDPAIRVTGSVPDIRPYLRGAAVAVAPMRIARGVQNKILEALAMDVPVVASSLAAAALPNELASPIAAESEPERLADCVVKCLLKDPRKADSKRTYVKRYMDGLDLPGQLERHVSAAAAQRSEACEDQVEVAV
jgi:glycosyltransferase involved in cell wall biosynthesis